MNKRKCRKCGSQMERRPIAGRWVCYECMQAPEKSPFPVPIDEMITLWIAETFMRVNAHELWKQDQWLRDAFTNVNARDMDS